MVFNSPWSHSVGRSKQWRRKHTSKANAAAIYEEQKVKAIFGPLAAATLNAVSIFDADTILDVACGTGIMARCLRERLGPSVRISGADLNEGMIDTARALTSGDPDGFDWKIADPRTCRSRIRASLLCFASKASSSFRTTGGCD